MSEKFRNYLKSTSALIAATAIAATPLSGAYAASGGNLSGQIILAQSDQASDVVEQVEEEVVQPVEEQAQQPQAEEQQPATDQAAEQPAEPVQEQPAQQAEEQPAAAQPEQQQAEEQPAPEQPAQQQAEEQPPAEQPAAESTDQAVQEEKPRKQRRDRQQAEEQPAQQPVQQDQAAEQPAQQPASETATEEEQQQAVQEAQQPATVSDQAEKPKAVEQQSAQDIVKEAETEPTAVVTKEMSREQRQQLRQAEQRRREKARNNRDELIGAAAAGIVIGATIPLLGGTVAADEGDRIIIRRDGRLYVRKDDSALFRDRDNRIDYERMRGGLTRETVTRRNGSQIITVRDAGGRVLRRVKVTQDGRRIVLFDTRDEEINRPYRPIDLPRYRVEIPRERYVVSARQANRELFYDTFRAAPVYEPPRRYSLQDIRENPEVRGLVRRVDLDTITFDSGSAFVSETQVALLGDIAGGMLDVIDQDPGVVFLIEGHTDAVGKDIDNLALSDRRAETVARILTEYYDVPPENMVVQGYGEAYLKVQTEGDERANRRVTVRNISPILQTSAE